ncbi:thiopurine S-methyltransferase [Glaciecola sp. MF2-115]|uniref:thiopurine S-methyltransferase n=1 Tax=Glaciecola sp. MF2-115 TaxID=3384827 RepID=UPI0039A2DF96
MEPDFWHRRWQKNEIGFHETEGNGLLKQYFDKWGLPNAAHIFVPLCGKTKDIEWFLMKGFSVVAIELNEDAVKALFAELGVEPKIESHGQLKKYSVENLLVYVGDFFHLKANDIANIDGTFDRAALVALPEPMRIRYSQHLREITHTKQQFLVTFDYDQSLFAGPPFSVTNEIVNEVYSNYYNINQLHRGKMEGGFRGEGEIYEGVYLLSQKAKK